MSTFRTIRSSKNFVEIPNETVRDSSLSLKARGLLVYALSFDEKWNWSMSYIYTYASKTDGPSSIKTGMAELKEHGYLEIIKKNPSKTDSGRYEYEYIFRDCPDRSEKQGYEKQEVENQPLENQPLENRSLKEYVSVSVNPNSVSVISNPNKEINNKNTNNIPSCNVPQGELPSQPSNEPHILSEKETYEMWFEQFWKEYPSIKRKADKKKCLTRFENIPNLKEEFPRIIQGLRLWKKDKDWVKENGQYIPAPLVFLNQRRWEGIIEQKSDQLEKGNEMLDFLREMDPGFYGKK